MSENNNPAGTPKVTANITWISNDPASHGQTIEEYDPKSKGSLAYQALANEVVKRTK